MKMCNGGDLLEAGTLLQQLKDLLALYRSGVDSGAVARWLEEEPHDGPYPLIMDFLDCIDESILALQENYEHNLLE